MGRVQNGFDQPQISEIIRKIVQNWTMKFRKVSGILLVLTGLFQFSSSSFGFALLGPFASWMEETNGLRQPGDIGGPMDIGSGYRWNVPIVTYGFDQSFRDYFGPKGVAAVENAIQILNDLPSASDVVLTNYPLDSESINYQAQAQNLYDLKSATLVALLEQMGLTQPTRYVFALRQWDPLFLTYATSYSWPDGTIPNDIVMRNFDPETLAASVYVNGALYNGYVMSGMSDYYLDGEKINVAFVIPVDPLAANASAVADGSINNLLLISPGTLNPGTFFMGLTEDDVGGLRYLLSADNVNYEKLLPDVRTFGPSLGRTGNGAWRPGVEKITFVPQPTGPRPQSLRPFSYNFTDVYFRNNVLMQQRTQRIIREPDFLFCAADTGENNPFTPWVVRTGTTNWLNNAALNGNTNGEGPGVIQPPITITFHKLGPRIDTGNIDFSGTYNQGWGSFDASTNLPVLFPSGIRSTRNQLTVRLRFFDTNSPPNTPYLQLTNITWHLHVPIGGLASLQISTNQIDWTSLAVATSSGSVIEWYHYDTDNPPKFFRVLPQSTPRH